MDYNSKYKMTRTSKQKNEGGSMMVIKMTESKFRNRKPKPVIFCFKWLMKLRGRFVRDKCIAEAVCLRYCARLKKRTARETIFAENMLAAARQQAAQRMVSGAMDQQKLASPPLPDGDTNSATSIRIKRAENAARSSATANVAAGRINLAQLDQQITSIELVLEERIVFLRKGVAESLYAYCAGVRKKFPDFNLKMPDDDTALALYKDRHSDFDEELKAYIRANPQANPEE